jgi:hypothetical protein
VRVCLGARGGGASLGGARRRLRLAQRALQRRVVRAQLRRPRGRVRRRRLLRRLRLLLLLLRRRHAEGETR